MTRSLVFFASALTAILVSGCFDLEMPDKVVFDAEGVWCDNASELCWQNPAGDQTYTANAASDYCDELTLEGYSDWRLPTISELRTLISGWDTTMTGGSCGVTDECLDWEECLDDSCMGDEYWGGPGGGGCYWVDEVVGICESYWSSSPCVYPSDMQWVADFARGEVNYSYEMEYRYARCVRDGTDADTDTDTDAGALTK